MRDLSALAGRAPVDDAARAGEPILDSPSAALYLGLGGIAINWLAPELQPIEAFSTVFSAIGVFGPSFVPVAQVIALPGLAKVIFIVGMLAGRLEILPLLVFFNLAAWRQ